MTASRFQRILVALDDSPRAAGVLAAAIDVARRFGGKMLLFRAVGIPLEIPPAALSLPPSALPEMLEAHARDDLAERARAVPPELLAKTAVKIGVPWQAICREATEEDADLVILGSHGYGGIDRLIGTTASRVVHHADRPVMIVRDRPNRRATA